MISSPSFSSPKAQVFDMDDNFRSNVTVMKRLRDQEAYLGITHGALPTEEIRAYFRKMVVTMNKKFCHLKNSQIMSSPCLARYIDSFFNALLALLGDFPQRQMAHRLVQDYRGMTRAHM